MEALRNRQVKNFFTLLLTSVGAPLILMGDEVRRTQQGNNNVYCQDNELSWFDWTLLDKHGDVRRFVKELIAGRLAWGQGRTDDDILLDLLRRVDFQFYDVDLNPADVGDTSHSLAVSRQSPSGLVQFFSDDQRLLGTADVPGAAARPRQEWLAGVDRHQPAVAARHSRLERCAPGDRRPRT